MIKEIVLHDWQRDVADRTLQAFEDHKRVVMCCPTGGGKTVMALLGVILDRLEKVLWVTHRQFLQEQVREYDCAGVDVVSVFKDVSEVQDYDLVVIDEAHHTPANSYGRVLEVYSDTNILGLTATPYRLDGQGLGQCGFGEIVMSPTIYELSKQGYLAPLEDLYSDVEGKNPWPLPKVRDLILQHRDRWGFQRGVVYGRSLEENRQLACLLSADLKVEAVDYKLGPQGIQEALARFTSGETELLVNHTLLTEGYDLPLIDYVCLNRHTSSRALWKQIYGRAMRLSGEKISRVVDLAGNHLTHGRIFDEEEITLTGEFVVSRPMPNPNLEVIERETALESAEVWDAASSLRRYGELTSKIDRRAKSRRSPVCDIRAIWHLAGNYFSLSEMAADLGIPYSSLYGWCQHHRPEVPEAWKLPRPTRKSQVMEDLRSGEAARFPSQSSYLKAKDLAVNTLQKALGTDDSLSRPSHWFEKKTLTEQIREVETESQEEFIARVGCTSNTVRRILSKNPEIHPPHWTYKKRENRVNQMIHQAVNYSCVKEFAEATGLTNNNVRGFLSRNPDIRPSHWETRKSKAPSDPTLSGSKPTIDIGKVMGRVKELKE